MANSLGSLVTLQGITKQFGGVRALSGTELRIDPGEVLEIVGHNGAGKTTLMHVLIGTMRPTEGSILVDGQDVTSNYDVSRAHSHGIRCVFQEPSLCPNLRVFENTRILHHTLRGRGWAARARRLISESLDEIFPGHGISPDVVTGRLPAGARQMVEIARAFTVTDHPVRIVILDEPTSSLDVKVADQLLQFMRRAAQRGISCIFISHRLKEVIANTDRIVVMRDGRIVARQPTKGISEEQLVESMGTMAQATESADEAGKTAGKPVSEPIAASSQQGADASNVRIELQPSTADATQLIARAGEVIGLGGLAGHGQRDALLAAFAAARSGGRGGAVRGTVSYVSGDRHREGIFPLWSVGRNLTIGLMKSLAHSGFLSPREETETAKRWRDEIHIRTPDVGFPILSLSGGNQQKVLIARALANGSDIVLLDDPMRGVDVATKREMFAMIRSEAAQGKCFVLYTTETQELSHCDRVYVFYSGSITEEIAREDLTEDRVLRASFRDAHGSARPSNGVGQTEETNEGRR